MQNHTITNYLREVEIQAPSIGSVNKYVYFKQNFVPKVQNNPMVSSKVLVNPHFNKKVFVNPNYIGNNSFPQNSSAKIHVNPKMANALPQDFVSHDNTISKIHVNPKMLMKEHVSVKIKPLEAKQNHLTYSSKTKLIRTPLKAPELRRPRRTSIYSKFKVIKSAILNKSSEIKTRNKLLYSSKYKLRRESPNKLKKSLSPLMLTTRFKLDNRRNSSSNNLRKNTKYVFVNRFLSISDIAKKVPLKTKRKLNLVNISGIIYKNSPNLLQKLPKREKGKNILLKQNKYLSKTRYNFDRVNQAKSFNVDRKKTNLRVSIKKQKVSREKLKKCNIPCLYYKKFGKCKGKDVGKCPRKHDPDQIALCTKFLQGACIDSTCLLSHNVSAEKMPTCKYYLEGSCSRDNCPYLHVRISPKADICKDFLEGFCKKASGCDKRHQFLCPDFEKADCLKPRCPYPHGRMVRKYSDFNKYNFAKKSSKNIDDNTKNKTCTNLINCNLKVEEKIEPDDANNPIRYYNDKKDSQHSVESESSDKSSNQQITLRLRPKLGMLPSFILLEDA